MDENKKRNKKIIFCVREKERNMIIEAANEDDSEVGPWIRKVIFDYMNSQA